MIARKRGRFDPGRGHGPSREAQAEVFLEELDRTCRQAEAPWTLVLIPSQLRIDPKVCLGSLGGLHLEPADPIP